MTEDQPGENSGRRSFQTNRGGNGGRGLGMLGALLPFLLKKPKLLLLVGLIVAGIYFFGGGSFLQSASQSVMSGFSQGANFDQKIFDEALVYEPLSEKGNTLPERVSLFEFCPTARNQGQQGSCVGWGSAYAARTIVESQRTGRAPNEVAFSPAFLYNQIKLEGCQGSYIHRAMQNMEEVGSLPFTNFGYTDESCDRAPTSQERNSASPYKMKGSARLTKGGEDYTIDLLAIKQNLSQGAPVVIGMMVGQSFMQPMIGKSIWEPTESDFSGSGLGGHCMCVIGYDDYLEGGCFEIMNSWGKEWGKEGRCWVRYNDFLSFTKEAYSVFPMGNADQTVASNLELDFSLILNGSDQTIGFIPKQNEENTFVADRKLNVGDRFKVAITNSYEAYVYIFGQEVDGSIYTLFPYTPKHSPYCGISGRRVFPKDYSLEVDANGNRDVVGVVITQQPIEFKKLNEVLNTINGASMNERLKRALAQELSIAEIRTTSFGLKMTRTLPGKNAIFCVLEIEK